MKKFEWNIEGGETNYKHSGGYISKFMFNKLKELKLTNGIDKKPKKHLKK